MAKFAFIVSNTDSSDVSALREDMLNLKLKFNHCYELNTISIENFKNFTDLSQAKIKEFMKLSLAAPYGLQLYNSSDFASDHFCQLYIFSDDAECLYECNESLFEDVVNPSKFFPFTLGAADVLKLKLLDQLDDLISKLYQVVAISDKSIAQYMDKYSKVLNSQQLKRLGFQLDYKTRSSDELELFRLDIKNMKIAIYKSGW